MLTKKRGMNGSLKHKATSFLFLVQSLVQSFEVAESQSFNFFRVVHLHTLIVTKGVYAVPASLKNSLSIDRIWYYSLHEDLSPFGFWKPEGFFIGNNVLQLLSKGSLKLIKEFIETIYRGKLDTFHSIKKNLLLSENVAKHLMVPLPNKLGREVCSSVALGSFKSQFQLSIKKE